MAFLAASLSSPLPVLCSVQSVSGTNYRKQRPPKAGGGGAGRNIAEVMRKDTEFIKKGLSKGLAWANDAFRIPQLSKTVEDLIWFRPLEDPHATASPPPASWPQPYYPELTGVDLFVADLKALEAYISYFYCLSKMWTKPLPEVYDAQEVMDYFSLRPHVVGLRLLEIFIAFASAAIRIRISGFLPLTNKDVDKEISLYNFGMVLKETMLNLGPTFIKVGQSLSTRPDITGAEISKALSELHDQIPPFPRAVAMKIIEEELGSPAEIFFRYISEEPVAAASFGQVYRGITHDGFDVAVKVQRPNLLHVVVRDIHILRLGLGFVQKIAKRKSDLRLYADELGKGLVGELDYTLEAANASEFMEAHSSFGFMHIPKVFHHLSQKRVLTMEWMVGESPSDLMFASTESINHGGRHNKKRQSDAKRHLLDLVNKGVESSLVQLLETGLLHADPHPGNLRYTSSGQIGFLDFGLLCRMERRHQYAMLASIVHIVNGDWESLVYALIEMDVVRPGTNIRRVTMELEDSLGEVEFNNGIPDIKFSRVLGKIWSVALKYHFRMPPYYTLLLRSLASLEGLAVAADPSFKTFEAAYPYVVRKLLTDNSAAMRKILHSVVFNKRKEFQWQKLALFLRVGTARKALQSIAPSTSRSSLLYSSDGATNMFDIAKLILKLLPSKDGLVLRRLLMTANGASLVRAMVSREANLFRKQLCRIIADIMYQWMRDTLGNRVIPTHFSSHSQSETANIDIGSSSRVQSTIYNYNAILQDRRLKLIFLKLLGSARRDPILMLRLCWTSFVMVTTASALACHRMLVYLSEAYLARASVFPKRVAVGV